MARPQFNLDDIMVYTWATDCSMPSVFCELCRDAPVFYTAVQEAAAATVIQAVVRKRLAIVVWKCLAMMAAAATVIESAARRRRPRLVLQCLRATEE